MKPEDELPSAEITSRMVFRDRVLAALSLGSHKITKEEMADKIVVAAIAYKNS